MSGEEFRQIATAVISAAHINLAGQGMIVPVDTVIKILEAHCQEMIAEKTPEGYKLVPSSFSGR